MCEENDRIEIKSVRYTDRAMDIWCKKEIDRDKSMQIMIGKRTGKIETEIEI